VASATCTACGGTIELAEEASYSRCSRCGAVNLIDSVPPWSLADAGTGQAVVAVPPGIPSSRPPPPRRGPVATRSAPPGSHPPQPADTFADDLVAIQCERCGVEFDGPVGLLHCPRCGAHQSVDDAPPWEVESLDESS
jgi:Zn finger protein HypA/HybF involved in hydrogenase expression